MRLFSTLLIGTTALSFLATAANASPGYLRSPSAAAQMVAFEAEQSVWTAPAQGGQASRLTSNTHVDPQPVLSPDGRNVAFLADFDGPTEIYVMPVAGGTPKRVTFESLSGRVAPRPIGWDAHAGILYSTTPDTGPAFSRIVASVDPATLARHVYPLADANDAALSPDGRWIYFVRFGTAISGDHLRAYRGGALSQLWRFDLQSGHEAERIGPQDVNLRRPMLWRDRLVVVSDQNGRYNLWSYALDGTDPQQLTHHIDFGIEDASLANDRIVYQLGADLFAYDLAGRTTAKLPIDIATDDAARRPQWLAHPFRYLNDIALAPNGQLAALTFRGHVILAGSGPRRRVQIADAPNIRLRHAVVSPDGQAVYAFSDASGESEIWRFPTNGDGHGTQLTHGGHTEPTGLYISPDGKRIAHTDLFGRLSILDIASGTDRVIDDATKDGTNTYDTATWSSDSQALVFVRTRADNIRRQMALYTVGDGKILWLTDGKYESYAPRFSPDGHWLWFLSDRTFNLANDSPWGDRNMGPAFPKRTGIYALALQPNEKFPFQPRTELDAPPPEKPASTDKNDKKTKPASIVTAGLPERLYKVPVPSGDYQSLDASDEFLFVLDGTDDANPLKSIHIDNEAHKIETFAPSVEHFEITPDGKTMLLRKHTPNDAPPSLLLVPTGAKLPTDTAQNGIKLDDLRLRIDPGAEWAEMFDDAWRLRRDHFYDRNLLGVNWDSIRARYRPLVARLSDRSDLDDLLGQMVGELGALHSQLRPADVDQRPSGDLIAGLGAHLAKENDGFRITHIDAGDPDLPDQLSPLLAPGVDARNGDLIVAVNGQNVVGAPDLSDVLADQAGRQVLLTLRRNGKEIRTVVVATSARQESNLRYGDWELGRAQAVEKASNGRIGYLHLRAMTDPDIASFARDFYANLDKDGIVIDVRRNMGGNIDSWVLSNLLRRPWMFWGRYNNAPAVNMQQSFRGHIVVICDEFTYSDGETFSQGIKSLHIAPLIGMRTAGAGVWLSDSDRLIDKGMARTAENPYFDLNGHWLVENHGVEPDVVVENMPHATFNGDDQQLMKAVDTLKLELQKEPIQKLVPEAFRPAVPAPQ
ncbi:Tricorn protease-like protein [Neoasaia chiangmaiensis NBRC 101099]|uniref:Tricorn protease homolog n=1 Tax=Neoasaia chiangmaiensis TaxID=320497 RepID=A0A1U9KTF9_9PROT|nr:S41 family peptidase [Neoasaia chiangmaiensis]AQS88960.1 Tricorn protease-like protein [Neoasaia chiangmaiensis]GBR40284.1 Tricorn protease-like protein [Neoasaia chiangmaiensis NBRC 101099]GEN13976.1 tricorn protease [Neoasaia chiangmaiensis]